MKSPASQMRWLLAVGCAAFLAALLWNPPAAIVAYAIERLSGQALQLRAPTGSAWKGIGRLYARQRSGEHVDLGPLSWTTRPARALLGKLPVDLAIGGSGGNLRVELSAGTVTVRGLNLELPGRLMASLVPALEGLGPLGQLRIGSENLRLESGSYYGVVALEWRPMQLSRLRGVVLGSHVARLRGAGENVDVELTTLEGPLRLNGTGNWKKDSGLELAGTIEHGEDRTGELSALLQGLCSEYSPGRCGFRFRQ